MQFILKNVVMQMFYLKNILYIHICPVAKIHCEKRYLLYNKKLLFTQDTK